MKAFWNKLDPKLKAQLLTSAVTYALLKLAVPVDPVLEGVIAIAAGAIAGYETENAGTLLKEGDTEPLDSGGIEIPKGARLSGDVKL